MSGPTRMSGEHDIGGHAALAHSVQGSCNFGIVASPVCPEQNIMPAKQFLLYVSIFEHGLLVNLAGKTPCCCEVDENRLPLSFGSLKSVRRKGFQLQPIR